MEQNAPGQTMFDNWRNNHFEYKKDYSELKTSFVRGLMPELSINLNVFDVLGLIASRFGNENLSIALNHQINTESPVANSTNSQWLKKSKMVGVNIRTIGNFFNLVKYSLTLGNNIDSIHILPIWEPGVVGSLYGKTSWNINPEFHSVELQQAIPQLDTPAKQLKVCINLLHLMGKTVGMDVIPHTDRFSEMVFLYPSLFEWIYREVAQLINVDNHNSEKIEDLVWEYLVQNPIETLPQNLSKSEFFDIESNLYNDEQKSKWLFGEINQSEIRLKRRLELMQLLLKNGFETYPVTMAPPYRNLKIEEHDYIVDDLGLKWYNYQFEQPEGMSRVFGPLTRYKFFNAFSNSQELDFDNPNKSAWAYTAEKYYQMQREFNFDFMRGDMAHVQPRKGGVSANVSEYYDPLAFIKSYIVNKGVKYFGFFAETFLAPDNTMGYGIEADHLEAIQADSTLGDLQASKVGSELFMSNLEKYIDFAEKRKFAPNFTIMTADKDDPRFDEFFEKGNLLRYFVGTFLCSLPSYISLGFECRNSHLTKVPNEEYSKLYVFQINDDNQPNKVTHGPFVWGKNERLFAEIEKLKLIYDNIKDHLTGKIIWHSKPGTQYPVAIWQYDSYVFVVNFSNQNSLEKHIDEKYLNQMSMMYSSLDFEVFHECRIYKM